MHSPLDRSTRPKAPRIPGATQAHRRHGQRLAAIHRMHLQQIEHVEAVIGRIEAGETEVARAGEAVAGLDMTANYRLFGNLCGQECLFLTFHHSAEDDYIFPALMQGSEGLRRVVERLAEEHLVIHAMIERLQEDAAALMRSQDADTFARLRETFAQLAATVRSHFGYEQTELEEAIGFHGIAI